MRVVAKATYHLSVLGHGGQGAKTSTPCPNNISQLPKLLLSTTLGRAYDPLFKTLSSVTSALSEVSAEQVR